MSDLPTIRVDMMPITIPTRIVTIITCYLCRIFSCPKCNESVNSQEVFLDKSCLRELQKLRIVCGCGWTGLLEEWEVSRERPHMLLNACIDDCGMYLINFSCGYIACICAALRCAFLAVNCQPCQWFVFTVRM